MSRRNRENWNLDFVVVVTSHSHCSHSLSTHPEKETRSGTEDSDRAVVEMSSPPLHRLLSLRHSMMPSIAAVIDSQTIAACLCSIPVLACQRPKKPTTMNLSVVVAAAVDHLMLSEPVSWFRPSMKEDLQEGDGPRALCPNFACHVCVEQRFSVLSAQMVHPTKSNFSFY